MSAKTATKSILQIPRGVFESPKTIRSKVIAGSSRPRREIWCERRRKVRRRAGEINDTRYPSYLPGGLLSMDCGVTPAGVADSPAGERRRRPASRSRQPSAPVSRIWKRRVARDLGVRVTLDRKPALTCPVCWIATAPTTSRPVRLAYTSNGHQRAGRHPAKGPLASAWGALSSVS
jgi:hypothetical protein